MTGQLNISLGVLKHITDDLNDRLEGVNIASLRICRQNNTITVYTNQGHVKDYNLVEIGMKTPMVEPNRMLHDVHPTLGDIFEAHFTPVHKSFS